MKKLYYEDAYIQTFTAEVDEIIEKGNEYHVVLDQTAFYPGGGGQPCDTGFIETFPVTSVYEENDKIYHVIHKKLIKIHKVKCSIDWAARFDAMQQHLGQHILSACFLACYDAKTSSFHLGKDRCTIDIDIPLTQNQLQEVEQMANQVIFNRLPVEILYPSKAELKKLSLKDLPKGKGDIRIVRIPELDVNPCGGVHPATTV
ncbi:MAG: alanyl-tRNA editing protein, partial [Turicibacter sp.]